MPLQWLDAKAAQAFGGTLADFFKERVPIDTKLTNAKFSKKTLEVLAKIERQAVAFKAEQGLNVYKKAKLGNRFKWRLRDAGYDSAYVDRLTEWLLMRL